MPEAPRRRAPEPAGVTVAVGLPPAHRSHRETSADCSRSPTGSVAAPAPHGRQQRHRPLPLQSLPLQQTVRKSKMPLVHLQDEGFKKMP